MLEKENLENGMFVFKVDGKEFIFNVDFKLPKKPKSMFQILQSIAYEAQPAAYCSKLSFVPESLEDFFKNLDKFMNQNEYKKVVFHQGIAI